MLILITGGSCSGKSVLASKFNNATIISMDDFYLGKSQMTPPYNFDKPEAVNLDLLFDVALNLKSGKETIVPEYSMIKSEKVGTYKVKPTKIIVIEGIFTLHLKKLRDIADLKIYIDVDSKERLKRRIIRDVERGRNKEEIISLSKNVDKMNKIYVEPQKKYADLVLY